MDNLPQSDAAPTTSDGAARWRELTAVILLSVTVILTAWTSFQAAKWGGAMSISFSQASAARIEAARYDGEANRQTTVQVGLFAEWVQAQTEGNTEASDFIRSRFPEPLASAFTAWFATDPFTNADAPSTPFEMPEFAPPGLVAAAEADARAEEAFTKALNDNQRGDNYTLLAVVFASVLFFAAMSGRVSRASSSWLLLGVALALFTGATALLLSFPRLI